MNKYDPVAPFAGHKPLFTNEVQAEYNVTSLNNGFTVLTESQTFPGAVNMGKSNSFQPEEKRRAAARFYSCEIINYNSVAAEQSFYLSLMPKSELTII